MPTFMKTLFCFMLFAIVLLPLEYVYGAVGSPADIKGGGVNGGVLLVFNPVDGARNYNVYKSISCEGPYELVANVCLEENRREVFYRELNIGTSVVFYSVASVDSAGIEGSFSSPFEIIMRYVVSPGYSNNIKGVMFYNEVAPEHWESSATYDRFHAYHEWNFDEEVPAIRQLNPSNIFLIYKSMQKFNMAGPNQNTIFDQDGDIAWVLDYYPDWFLLDADRQRIPMPDSTPPNTEYVLDLTNPSLRDFMVSRIVADIFINVADGFFGDNVWPDLSWIRNYLQQQGRVLPVNYTDDFYFNNGVLPFFSELSSALNPYNLCIGANISIRWNNSQVRVPSLYPYLTIYMIERFCHNFDAGWFRKQVEEVRVVHQAGKSTLLTVQGDPVSNNFYISRGFFAGLCAFLLVKSDTQIDTFRYASHPYIVYNIGHYFIFDRLNLGKSIGDCVEVQNGVFMRTFKYGMVLLNLNDAMVTLNLGGTYIRFDNRKKVRKIELNSKTGMVLYSCNYHR